MAGKNRMRAGRGSLALIIGLLISSAFLRLGTGTGQAIAREIKPDTVATQSAEMVMPKETETNVSSLLTALKAREEALEKKERKIEDRMKALSMAENAVDQKLASLIDAEEKLRATLSLADGAAEDDLTRLTTVYESMKPKDAAALFEEMAPEFAAGFLGRMRPDAAAGIMAGLDAETAYTISVFMAGRHANVPKD